MRFRHTLVSALVALAAGGLLAVGPAVAVQDTSGPPGGRESAPSGAPTTAPVIDPTTAQGSSVAPTAVLDGATQTRSADAASERDVRRIVLTLLGIAAVMALTTVGFWWATKPLAPELDRLARMGTRGFRRASSYERREMLGASPLARLARLEDGAPARRAAVVTYADPGAAGSSAVESRPAGVVAERVGTAVPHLSAAEQDPALAMERPVLPPDPSAGEPSGESADPVSDEGLDEVSGSGSDEGSDSGSDEGSDEGLDEVSGSGLDEGSGSGSDEGSGSGSDEGSDEGLDEGSGSGSDEGSGSGSDEGSDEGSDARRAVGGSGADRQPSAGPVTS
jgi:hypothetical protein